MANEPKPGPSGMNKKHNVTEPVTEQPTYRTSAEYFTALENWLKDAYMWQSVVASFPYYLLMTNQMIPSSYLTAANQAVLNNNIHTNFIPYVAANGAVYAGSNVRTRRVLTANRPQFRQNEEEGREFAIPSLWKRFVAEFVDFLILFFLKLAVTFIAVDFFDFIDLEKYDIEVIQRNMKVDYRMAMEMTSEILVLELVHRVVVCIFETFFLQRGLGGQVGGATPGKAVMGLRVVSCVAVTPIDGRPQHVMVYPGGDLGLGWALARSFLKNLVLAILFPICFAMFFFRHNRTGYDLLCRSIVVENPRRQRH